MERRAPGRCRRSPDQLLPGRGSAGLVADSLRRAARATVSRLALARSDASPLAANDSRRARAVSRPHGPALALRPAGFVGSNGIGAMNTGESLRALRLNCRRGVVDAALCCATLTDSSPVDHRDAIKLN